MVRHREQKVGVFIDVQNMYYSAKQLYENKVDFTQILKEAVSGRKLIRAVAYAINTEIKEESVFHDALTNIGFEVKLKDLQIFHGGAKKGDWDIGIAMDIVRMANKLDVVVLVSGDGDFRELLEWVKAQGCRAEVIAFGRTSSTKLKKEADMFIDMGKDVRRYLIKGRRIARKPHHMHQNSPKPSSKEVRASIRDVPKSVAGASKPVKADVKSVKIPAAVSKSVKPASKTVKTPVAATPKPVKPVPKVSKPVKAPVTTETKQKLPKL